MRFPATDRPADSAFGLEFDDVFRKYGQQHESPARFRSQIASGQPALLYFWYRQSPGFLVSPYPNGVIREWAPPATQAGMVDINVDPEGRLTWLAAIAPAIDEPGPAPPPDWPALFTAAGLDQSRFVPAIPKVVNAQAFDTRAAWVGTLARSPELALRIEASSWKGRPVFFGIYGPWANPAEGVPFPGETLRSNCDPGLDRRNVHHIHPGGAPRDSELPQWQGRCTRRLAVGGFRLHLLDVEVVSNAKHHAGWIEYDRFLLALGAALFSACAFAFLCLALEPYLRRRMPETLISWTRLLGGGWKDPLVGGHILLGIAAGVCLTNVFFLENLLIEPPASGQYGPNSMVLDWLLDGRHIVSALVDMLTTSMGLALAWLFLVFTFQLILRRTWMAYVALFLLLCPFYALRSANFLLGVIFMAITGANALLILRRCGVLGTMALVGAGVLHTCPLTADFSAWHTGNMFIAIGVVLALTIYWFHIAVAGRPLFRARFLEE